MQTGITITETNSSNDSRGEAFGLSGNQYLYIVIAFVISLGVLLGLHLLLRCSFVGSITIAIGPFLLTVAYILCLKRDKPDGYDRDYIENILYGAHWTSTSKAQLKQNNDDLF